MLRFDYHLHTQYSMDGKETLEAMVLGAIGLGLEEIALTDHCDFLYKERPFPFQIDYYEYKPIFETVREKYAGKINMVFGVEVGVNSYSEPTVKKLMADHGFDFVIASVHDIHGADLYNGEFFKRKDKRTAYLEYFDTVLEAARNINDYCVLGHLDFVSRYGPYPDSDAPYSEFGDIIDEILKAVIKKGKGIEINTSGFRYGIGRCYPSYEILKRYSELGGSVITVGSDAHRAADIAKDFNCAEDMLKTAGFSAVCKFRKREPYFVNLD